MIKKEREIIILNENIVYIRYSEVCRVDGSKIIKFGWKGVNF